MERNTRASVYVIDDIWLDVTGEIQPRVSLYGMTASMATGFVPITDFCNKTT